jgi:hypothetical protein
MKGSKVKIIIILMDVLTIVSPFLVVLFIAGSVGVCIMISIIRHIILENSIRYEQV